MIIGCGGSARAIAAGLQSLRLASITVIGRRQEALDAFIADLQSNDAPLTACLQSSPNLASLMKRADLVVNTTPVGMAQHGDAQAFPLGEAVWSQLQGSAMLYDLVYTPRPTAWLRWGQSRGHRCIDGWKCWCNKVLHHFACGVIATMFQSRPCDVLPKLP